MAADPSIHGGLDAALRQGLADMELRLLAGQPWDAGAFLAEHAAIASDSELVVDLLLHEYFLRRSLGEALEPEAWFRRFPRWEELLHRRLHSLQTVNGATPGLNHDAPTQDHTPTPDSRGDEETPELGRHALHEEIGRGGMGVVYRARDLVLNRPVALKMIVPRHGLLETPEAVRRFYREARAAARLRHPNIIAIHGMGLHHGRHCFTMPLLAGALSARTGSYRDDPRAAAALVEKIARAVQYAHDQGVIHRDLKPANILLDEQGEPLVADFGLAKILDADADASSPGQRVGTPAYMSPEQAAGHTWEVSPRSDVWAIGVILYELLTGARPFAEATPEGTYRRVLTGEPPSPRSQRADLPPELEAVVLKCLQKDPARRYTRAGELAEDLARWLRGERVRRAPLAWRQRFARAFRRPAVAIGALVLLAAGLFGAVALFWPLRFNHDPDQPLHDGQQQLAHGQAVTLIGESGPPAWSRWAYGGATMAMPDEKDGAFTFDTHNPAFLELFRDAPRGYRLSADVRHEGGPAGGEVGLYFGWSPAGAGAVHAFCALTFNDREAARRVNAPNASTARLAMRWRGDGEQQATTDLGKLLFLPAAKTAPGIRPWRRLTVEVDARSVRGFWTDGPGLPLQPVGTASADDLANNFQAIRFRQIGGQAVDQCPGLHPTFGPGQPLGLLVEDGAASFRRVVVEPLP